MVSQDITKSETEDNNLVKLAYSIEKMPDSVPLWYFLSEKGINIARHMYDEHQIFIGIHLTRQITIHEAIQYLRECCGMHDYSEQT